MDKSMQKLWIRALEGNKAAYRKLGILFLKESRGKTDRRLAELCLEKAAELGDEWGYVLYCRMNPKKRTVTDHRSYLEMRRDYLETDNPEEKKKLAAYLGLDKFQKQNMTNKRCKYNVEMIQSKEKKVNRRKKNGCFERRGLK